MTTATLKKINENIKAKFPELDLQLWNGRGYFYFGGLDGFDQIESLMVYSLNQMSLEDWNITVENCINDAYK